jgi:hypothetical protein
MTTVEDIYAAHIEVREVRAPGGAPWWLLRLKIDHQSFPIGINDEEQYESLQHAEWTGRQLAVALHRFKYGVTK